MSRCSDTIEWADFTANPFTGCLHGCDYCYARRMARRMGGMTGNQYNAQKQVHGDPFKPVFSMAQWDKFAAELHSQKKPRRIFLGSMSDLGGDWTWDVILNNGERSSFSRESMKNLVQIMAAAVPHHTFLMLTKNPAGMAGDWPDNCHIGVSADNEKDAFDRTLSLMENVRAKVRWISLEPLLHPVTPRYLRGLDWIVIGGQTGKGANPVDHKSVVDVWKAPSIADIPLFIKKNIRVQFPHEDFPMELPT